MDEHEAREVTVADAAVLVGGQLRGDGSPLVCSVRSPREAGVNDLAFVSDARYLPELTASDAVAVVVTEDLAAELGEDRSIIVVENGQIALLKLLEYFRPEAAPVAGVHPTAVVGREVSLGEDVSLGPYAVVGDGTIIGDRVRLAAHVVVGPRCTVGADSMLHPHAVLYQGVTLGERVILHSGARVGVEGFGYVPGEDGSRRIPHMGACVIGDDVEIGANTCVDRGSLDSTTVGSGTKLDNLVHIGHNVRVGEHTLMAALVGIAGSVHIGDGTMWGGQSGAVDHQSVGDGAKIAGKAGVSSDVPAGETVMGFPSRPHREHLKALAALYRFAELQDRVRKLEADRNGSEDQ
jgi:UDP-3-O-[3-hydroxymyristoyl] glucosamine N-acyltransferase